MITCRTCRPLYPALLYALLFCISCRQSNSRHSTWSVYKADAASTSYSALEQITDNNVQQLQTAWTFFPDSTAVNTGFASECNPIIIDSVMYITTGENKLYALNGGTGKTIWMFDPFAGGPNLSGEGGTTRGVAYWEEKGDKRILMTAGHYLMAIDATKGKSVQTFGNNGRIDLNIGMRDDPAKITVASTSPGIIYKNLLILGAWSNDASQSTPGYQRAYDVKTGKLVWTFHTIPHPGEPGYETWPKDAWKYAGGANDWGGMSLDEKRGLVFLATGSPSYDYYGPGRIGQNLFGNSVIALEAETGKLVWYFQTVHHDLWDYDLPAPPNLVTINRNGKKIDAVAQVSKTGFVYVLDRETGKPVFPIEEKPVPASDVPGEQAWPTQPFPTKPAPMSMHTFTESDLSSGDPAAHDSLVQTFRRLRYEGIFTPPSLQGTFTLPSSTGGAEWGGAAFDPETGMLYVKSNNSPEIAQMVETDKLFSQNSRFKRRTPFQRGAEIYKVYCSACHGNNREGTGEFPALTGIESKMPEEAALNRIKHGGGKMPAFENILQGNGQEEAIIDFLYGRTEAKAAPQQKASIVKTDSSANENNFADAWKKYRNIFAYRQFHDINGNPGIKPPFGLLNAINLNTGEYEWRTPVGNDERVNTDADQPTGELTMPGPMATRGGLVFIAGTKDKKLRAYRKTDGKLLWEGTLPGVGKANPATYQINGKQYIAITFSPTDEHPGGGVIAFSLR